MPTTYLDDANLQDVYTALHPQEPSQLDQFRTELWDETLPKHIGSDRTNALRRLYERLMPETYAQPAEPEPAPAMQDWGEMQDFDFGGPTEPMQAQDPVENFEADPDYWRRQERMMQEKLHQTSEELPPDPGYDVYGA